MSRKTHHDGEGIFKKLWGMRYLVIIAAIAVVVIFIVSSTMTKNVKEMYKFYTKRTFDTNITPYLNVLITLPDGTVDIKLANNQEVQNIISQYGSGNVEVITVPLTLESAEIEEKLKPHFSADKAMACAYAYQTMKGMNYNDYEICALMARIMREGTIGELEGMWDSTSATAATCTICNHTHKSYFGDASMHNAHKYHIKTAKRRLYKMSKAEFDEYYALANNIQPIGGWGIGCIQFSGGYHDTYVREAKTYFDANGELTLDNCIQIEYTKCLPEFLEGKGSLKVSDKYDNFNDAAYAVMQAIAPQDWQLKVPDCATTAQQIYDILK